MHDSRCAPEGDYASTVRAVPAAPARGRRAETAGLMTTPPTVRTLRCGCGARSEVDRNAHRAFREQHRECTVVGLHEYVDDLPPRMFTAHCGLTEVGWIMERVHGWTVYQDGERLTAPSRVRAEATIMMIARAFANGRVW